MNRFIDRYERLFMYITLAVLMAFMTALVLSATTENIHLQSDDGSIDATAVRSTAPFDAPGVYEVGPGRYQAVLIAKAWAFEPAEVRVPAGSEVEFIMTSQDVIHGFMIPETRVNAMVIPGRITRVTQTFDEPGEHNLICHEFCGIGHQGMYGTLVVEG